MMFAWMFALAFAAPDPALRPVSAGPRVALHVGAAGGVSAETRQWWAGLDVALHPAQHKGFSPIARADLQWGFAESLPFGTVEAGFTGVIPQNEATIRAGLAGRAVVAPLHPPVALPFGGAFADGPPRVAFAPGALGILELEWGNARNRTRANPVERGVVEALAVGIRAGANLALYQELCAAEDPVESCVGWRPDFVGGFSARLRLTGGFSAEAIVGPSPSLSVGYSFGPPRR